MRIAALYDIHGNLDALEAVLEEVEAAAPDLILLGGDVVLGPFPAETLDRLLALQRPVTWIRGNTDRVVVAPTIPEGDPWRDRIAWVAERLTPERRARIAGWPTTVTHEVEGLGPTVFCHGTPRDDAEIITPITTEERLREIMAGVEEPVVVGGHVHVQYDRLAAGKRIVNAGSVGMPYEHQRGACWALLGPGVQHRRTSYDLARAAERIRACGIPRAEDLVTTLLTPPTPEEVSERFERMATAARA